LNVTGVFIDNAKIIQFVRNQNMNSLKSEQKSEHELAESEHELAESDVVPLVEPRIKLLIAYSGVQGSVYVHLS